MSAGIRTWTDFEVTGAPGSCNAASAKQKNFVGKALSRSVFRYLQLCIFYQVMETFGLVGYRHIFLLHHGQPGAQRRQRVSRLEMSRRPSMFLYTNVTTCHAPAMVCQKISGVVLVHRQHRCLSPADAGSER